MRTELLYNPRLLLERLGTESVRRRRMARLRGTSARWLSYGHIDSLELLELAEGMGIRVIYDIGANAGTWTLLANALFPEAEIHAFEPLAGPQKQFRANVKGLDRVVLHEIALSSREEVRPFHVTEASESSSALPIASAAKELFRTKETHQITLRLEALDAYRLRRKFSQPDLIKLDVQGYEVEVLKGACNCLRHAKAIIAEVSFVPFYEGQCLFEDVVGFLRTQGFVLRALGTNTPLGQPLLQTDVLFARATSC